MLQEMFRQNWNLRKKQINLEYGKEFKADFDTLVDTKGLNKEDKEYLKKKP